MLKHVQQVHLLKGLFKCEVELCGKTFTKQSNLDTHMKVAHEGGKTFACPFANCHQIFGYKHVMERHVLSHQKRGTKRKKVGTKRRGDGKAPPRKKRKPKPAMDYESFLDFAIGGDDDDSDEDDDDDSDSDDDEDDDNDDDDQESCHEDDFDADGADHAIIQSALRRSSYLAEELGLAEEVAEDELTALV
jgi:hypothetical protein